MGAYVVVGGGAVGTLYAALLQRGGAHVLLATRTGGPRHTQIDSREFGSLEAEFDTVPSSGMYPAGCTVLLAVKYEQLPAVLPACAAAAYVVPLCNALGAHELVHAACGERTLVGHTSVEVTRVAGGGYGYEHYGKHRVFVGARPGGAPYQAAQATVVGLRSHGLNAQANHDGPKRLWQRGAVFTPLAALTAVYQLPIGAVLADPQGAATQAALLAEYAAVAAATGYPGGTTPQHAAYAMSRLPRKIMSSLARDVARGTAPEIDGKLGWLLRCAARTSVEVPVYAAVHAALQQGTTWDLAHPQSTLAI